MTKQLSALHSTISSLKGALFLGHSCPREGYHNQGTFTPKCIVDCGTLTFKLTRTLASTFTRLCLVVSQIAAHFPNIADLAISTTAGGDLLLATGGPQMAHDLRLSTRLYIDTSFNHTSPI